MNFQDLVDAVWTRTANVTRADVAALYGAVASDAMKANGVVPIPKIGRLVVKRHSARSGRNIRAGELHAIPASNRVVILTSVALKREMNPPAPAMRRAS